MSRIMVWLRQLWCSHEFSVSVMRRVSHDSVVCPCQKCGKVFDRPAGLYMPGKLIA